MARGLFSLMLDVEASGRAASLVYWKFVAVFEQLPHMLFWAVFADALKIRHWMRGLQSNCSHMSVRLGHLRSCHYMLPCSVGWPHASWVVFVSALVCWLQVVMYAVVFTRSRLGQKVWYVMSDETQAR